MVRHNAPVRSALALLLVLCASCGGEARTEAPAEVTGRITAIERDGAGSIMAFEVEDDDGPYRILIDPGRDYGFDLEHLVVHRDQELPVMVRLQDRAGDLYAIEILDA
jgi:hypothetical protein